MAGPLLSRLRELPPLGVLVITVLAFVSGAYVFWRGSDDAEGRVMWTFVINRAPVYQQIMGQLVDAGDPPIRVELIPLEALTRRLMSGFFSGTPLADIVEIERVTAASVWRGPLEAVGFVDLTERLHEEGLYERINEASFSPWTHRGHIFGLPADVHPVLLCYRADVFEAAGIDVDELDTWDKFFAATAGLVEDFSGDGRLDRYVLELQESEASVLSGLLLQAGVKMIDANGRPAFDTDLAAEVMAKLAFWAARPNKLTADVDLFTGAGHQLRMQGYVLAWIVPDWRAIQNEIYMGELAGKIKVMPLPAWHEGGRRTSSWGGSMLGFPTTSPNFEANWRLAKRLYLSRDLAVTSWQKFGVLTPVKEFWDDPAFLEPNPFYGGQQVARMYIEQAPHVPVRSSSPFLPAARREIASVFGSLISHAEETLPASADDLEPEASRLLQSARERLQREINRNVFAIHAAGEPQS